MATTAVAASKKQMRYNEKPKTSVEGNETVGGHRHNNGRKET